MGVEHAVPDVIPAVSVVVATYNRACLLREHLDSVLGQDFAEYEVVCVDDGSTDETPEVLAGYGRAHPGRLRTLRVDNGGQGLARNEGARLARGRFLLFTDDDVTVPANWISGMVAMLREHPCDAASGGFLPYAMDTPVERYLHHRMGILFGRRAKYVSAAPMMSFIVSAEAFWEAGGFIPEPIEDWVLCREMGRRGRRIYYDPAVSVVHRYQTEWAPAARRMRMHAALGLYDRRSRGENGALYVAYSTAKYLASPLWSLWRFPLDLYALSLRVESAFYFARLKAYWAALNGRALGPPDWWEARPARPDRER